MTQLNSTDQSQSVLERFLQTGQSVEGMVDSSPLVYENWAKKMIAEAPENKQALLSAQLKRLFNPQNPVETQFAGVTTNPPLSLAAMQNDPERWKKWIGGYLGAHPRADVEEVFWALYKEVVYQGAQLMRPSFEASNYRHGYVSAQVDPRAAFDEEKMFAQALELSAIAPNVMVKSPGTPEGIRVIGRLTARGIATNATMCFVMKQFVGVAEAVLGGLQEARAKGVDLTRWRSVVTDMSARWEDAPVFQKEAEAAGLEFTPELKRWGGVAMFKQAHKVFHQRAYPSKMLICSLRMGPVVNGEQRVWHMEKLAGADGVFTLPPSYITQLFNETPHVEYTNQIWEEIPAEVKAKLEKIPYVVRSMAPDGYALAELKDLESLITNHQEFSAATEKMVDFVRKNLEEQLAPAK